MEILASSKSQALEYIIIILITFECMLMLMDMSGLGPSVLSSAVLEHFGHTESMLTEVSPAVKAGINNPSVVQNDQ